MTKADKFVREIFLKLTSKTYPHGHEHIVARQMKKLGLLPKETIQDAHGNYFIKIGDSTTVFASHLDTVSKSHVNVKHVIDGDIIRTDGKTTLGADDKAGVTVMSWMIKHNIPGLYYFFIGEEVGCIGSGLASKYDFNEDDYDRIISFDRRGTGSVITHQSWSRCCSDVFADALCKELNKSGMSYKKDDGGVYTDSAEFVDIISECTNISVGYYKEHSTDEHQDINHLIQLADACLKVDWENLPTKRDKKVYEPKEYNYPTKSKSIKTTLAYDKLDIYESYDIYDTPSHSPANSGGWSRSGSKKYDGNKSKKYAEYEFQDDDDFYFKTPGLKAGSNVFFDNGGDELLALNPYDAHIENKQYNWILNKFSEYKLTREELDTIREQYLDIENSDYDKFFYEVLCDLVE